MTSFTRSLKLLVSGLCLTALLGALPLDAGLRIRFHIAPSDAERRQHYEEKHQPKRFHYETRRYNNDPWEYYYPYRRDNWRYDYHELAGYSHVTTADVKRWKLTQKGRVVVLDNGMVFQVIHPGYRWPRGKLVRVFARGYDNDRWFLGFRNGRFGYWLRPHQYVGHSYYRLVVNGEVFRARRVD